jgi:hypothetical protein
MPNNTQETKTVRKSFVVTFDNHPPIRLWGEFDSDDKGTHLGNFEDGTLWDKNQEWGHCNVCYYVTKSGKRLYWGSHNSGMSYGGHEPQTHRTFLKTEVDIKQYIIENGGEAEWNLVGHKVNPELIVDSDLL